MLVLVAGLLAGCSDGGDSDERAEPKVGKQVVVTTFDFDPEGVAVDGAGTVYTSGLDGKRHVIVSVPRKGKPTTRSIPCAPNVVTAGRKGLVVAAPDGTLYWSEFSQRRVVRIDPGGEGRCFAGTGKRGASGEGGPAMEAEIGGVSGMALDAERGDLYIADVQSARDVPSEERYAIKKIDAAGIITTLSGFGGESAGAPPTDVAFDARRGRWYVISVKGVISYRDGTNASRIIAGLDTPNMPFIAVAIDPSGGDPVAIRASDVALDHCEVMRVSDSGELRPVPGGLLPDCAKSVAVDASGDIWVATDRSQLMVIRPLR